MLTRHALACAKSKLNSESHWLVNGSFLPRTFFVKSIRLVWQVSDAPLWKLS